jgi:protein-disulfide isomerase
MIPTASPRAAFVVVLTAAAMQAAPWFAMPVAAQQSEQARTLQRAAQSRAKGPPNAAVTVYEISDFQCPFCARFAREIYPSIDSAFVQTGRVQWVFVNLPLPTHHNSFSASKAALCAGAVADRFWNLHSRLFETQSDWTGAADPLPHFSRMAVESGVATDAFTGCMASDRVAPLILQDVIFAATSRVGGTPTYIINNQQVVVGVKSFEEWRDLLEKELRRVEQREN